MAPKKSPAKVSFGKPIADLPDQTSGHPGGAPHWRQVADHCKENPGQFHPIRISTLTLRAHQAAVPAINAGKTFAFREGGFTAAYRDGALYVKYESPAKVRSIGKRAG